MKRYYLLLYFYKDKNQNWYKQEKDLQHDGAGKKKCKSNLKDRDFIFSLLYFNRLIEIDNNQTLIENNIRDTSNIQYQERII